MSRLRIGTRGSALALAQAGPVAEALGGELVVVRTAGDDGAGQGDKGRFVGALDEALLAGDVDACIHSAKDLPGDRPEGLRISAVPAREDPRDVLVGAASLNDLPDGAKVGTASLRRRSQLLSVRPDLDVVEVRGNVDTRLRKLGEGVADALVLALAGLRRLGREGEVGCLLDELVPAAGQGTLAVETREDLGDAERGLEYVSDSASAIELACERAAVAELEASCDTPVGVLARLEGDVLAVRAYVGAPDGSDAIRDELTGAASDPVALGAEMAGRLRAAGADEVLGRARDEA